MKQHINHYKLMLGLIVLLWSILACGFFEATPLEKARQAVSDGDIPTAMQEYSTTIDGEGSSAEDRFNALVERADLHLQQGDTEAALADYAVSLQLTTSDGQPVGNVNHIYRKRAEVYGEQAAWEQAVADWDAIITVQPDNYEALAKRGYAHLQLRNYEQAIADLKASFEGEVGDAKANVDSRSNLVEAYSDLGFVLLNVGEYEDALENYNQAYELAQGTSDEAQVLTDRGFAYSEIDMIDEAFADLNRAIELDPDKAMAYAYRSYVYGAQYLYDEAIADASKAVELGSDLPAQTRSAILHSRAIAYASTDQYQLAVADATESIELEGIDSEDSARTYHVRSGSHRQLGNYDLAIADSTQAIELGSTDITALSGFYRRRALAYHDNGQATEAYDDMNTAIGLDQETPNANNYELLGDMQYSDGNYEAAIESYQQGLALAPDNDSLHNSLGDAHYELDNLAEAETAYRAAITAYPDESLYHENLGFILRITEQYEPAITAYTDALALDSERAYSYVGRGVAHYWLDQYAEAEADLETSLTYDLSQSTIDYVNGYLDDIVPAE